MPRNKQSGLDKLLNAGQHIPSSLRIVELNASKAVLQGDYKINAQMKGKELITDSLRLRIEIDENFPEILPKVIDIGGRIPKSQDHHTYDDGSFCLGGDIVLKARISDDPTIGNFLYKCVDPFLYSVLYNLEHKEFPYGDLEHGESGLIACYELFFNVKGKKAVLETLRLLGKKKREANKLLCPCRCGLRVGRCKIHHKLNSLRKIASRRWYMNHLVTYFTPVISEPRIQPVKKHKKV